MSRSYFHKRKLFTINELLEYATRIKETGEKIVFTNGCFDIIHKGHIQYLRASRLLGDYLIIGLNSDKSVSRLKGAGRPINSCEDRALILEAFDFVDCVIVFDEDNPLNIIHELKPDIYTKGGDYDMANVVGNNLGKEIIEEYGGKVILIPIVTGVSTSELIRKMVLYD